jgi:hypothetical protein
MIDDPAPDEALDACLYAIDVKLAELRAHIMELRALDEASGRGVFAADALSEYVRWIERVLAEATNAQAMIHRCKLSRPSSPSR